MLTAMVAAIGAAATWLCALETLAELPFIGDQVVCLSHDQAGPPAALAGKERAHI